MQVARDQCFSEEQLLSLSHPGKAEMIDGRVIIAVEGMEHGAISVELVARLSMHCDQTRVGMTFGVNTGFWTRSGNLLS